MTATGGIWRKSTPQRTYSEDLSRHRISFKAPVTEAGYDPQQERQEKQGPIDSSNAVTEQLDYLLEMRRRASQQASQVTGFTIQVYTGNSRDKAFKARNKLYLHYPHLRPQINYNATNYTVRAGAFLDKLEAYKAYLLIKQRIPQAIIRPILLANRPNIFTNKPTQNVGASPAVLPTE